MAYYKGHAIHNSLSSCLSLLLILCITFMQGMIISFITTGIGLARIVTPLWGKLKENMKL